MRKYSLFLVIAIVVSFNSLSGYPGDHNGLTCTEVATLSQNDYYNEYYNEDKNNCPVDPENNSNLSLCAALDTPGAPRTTALEYIVNNLTDIQDRVRMHHEPGYDVAVLGDSLSDFVNFYGDRDPWFWDKNFSWGDIYRTDLGGHHLRFDSFDDYFAAFGADGRHIRFVNYGVAGATSESVTGYYRMKVAKDDELGIWDISSDQDRCAVSHNETALITNPGKYNTAKAKRIGWFGKESSSVIKVGEASSVGPPGQGLHGGYYREYGSLQRIYMKQNKEIDLTSIDQGELYSTPHLIQGNLLKGYISAGGPEGHRRGGPGRGQTLFVSQTSAGDRLRRVPCGSRQSKRAKRKMEKDPQRLPEIQEKQRTKSG